MEKNRKILIIAIVAIILVVGVFGVLMVTGSNVNPLAAGKNQIVVESDTKFNGSLEIFTYPELKSNSNGSYNYSQFYGSWSTPSGAQMDIPIVDGKATYDIPENVKFITFGSGHINKDLGSNSGKSVKVSLYANGELISQSIGDIYANSFYVKFGYDVYSTEGKIIPFDTLVMDSS